MKPWMLAVMGGTLDLAVAYLLLSRGFFGIGLFMLGVGVAGFVLAVVLWRRGRQ